MSLRASLLIVIALAIAAGANAQVSLEYEQKVLPSVFLRQAPADYLPMPREWESSAGEIASYDYLELNERPPEHLDVGEFLPQEIDLTTQAYASPGAFDTFGSTLLALQQEGGSAGKTPEQIAAEQEAMIAEALANPLSYLWLGFIQNDVINYSGNIIDALGEKDIVNNTTLIMPVLSIQLTEAWKTVIRPVIPINNFRTIDNINLTSGGGPSGPAIGVDFERESGLGDVVLWMALSKQYKPPDIFGFGLTTMFDTASEDQLGTGKNSAGPMALQFKITDKWIFGYVAQHWWSFSGQDTLTIDTNLGPVDVDRADVSLTDIQPVVRYRVSPKTNIGFAPNWRYNWETSQLNLPIGFGIDTLISVGPLPLKIGMEAYYFVESSSDFGPEWQFRLFFVPVFPAPKWAGRPLF
jgi:hypothetical protein